MNPFVLKSEWHEFLGEIELDISEEQSLLLSRVTALLKVICDQKTQIFTGDEKPIAVHHGDTVQIFDEQTGKFLPGTDCKWHGYFLWCRLFWLHQDTKILVTYSEKEDELTIIYP